jgi:putative transposase
MDWLENRLNRFDGYNFKVYKYILNQEAHHKKQPFRDEYREFLNNIKIEYDEQYIFQELI